MSKQINQNTKETILNTVEEFISKEGINSFTFRDVANNSHLALGTISYYYKSKDEIILDLIKRHLSGLNEEYFSWLNRHKEDLTKERFLDVILYKGVKLYDRGKIHLFLLNECIANKKLLKEYQDLYKVWKENLKIGTLQVFENKKDADTIASLLMLIIDGLIVQEVINNKTEIDEEKIKALIGGSLA